MNLNEEFSRDSLFDGRLSCLQPREGYRFSLDAVLLAHFIAPKKGDLILDLGAGCGIVGLILAYRHPEVSLTALELQSRLAGLARANFSQNGFAGRCAVIEGDCRCFAALPVAGSFDRVVCNPPYRRTGSGRQNLHAEEIMARHEIAVDLSAVLGAAAVALKNRGRAAFVYPASRGAALLAGLRDAKLEPKRLQIVHSYPGGNGTLILVEAIKGGGEELVLLAPFYIYQYKDGPYSDEMARLYRPGIFTTPA